MSFEEQLNQSAIKLLNNIPDLVYIYDLEHSRNVYTNRELYAMLGYTTQEFRNFGSGFLIQSVHPDDKDVVSKHLQSLIHLKDEEVREVTYRLKHKDGHYVWLQSKDIPHQRNERGEVSQVVGIASNVNSIKSKEEEVKHNRSLLLQTLHHINQAVYATDAEGNFTFLSEKARGLFNIPPLEIISHGEYFRELLRDEDLKKRDHVFLSLKPGEETTLEYPILSFAKHQKWILENIKRLGNVSIADDAQVFFGTFQDITQRKEVEQQLEASRRVLELSIKASNDGIWQFDMHTETFDFSERWYQILGYEKDELGSTFDVWLELLHPEDREAAKNKAFHDLEHEARYDDNYRLKHKHGHYIDVINRALFIKNDQGKVKQIIGSITDISSVKDSERKLQASESRLQEAQHISRIAHWSYSFKKKHFEANDWFYEVAGLGDPTFKEGVKNDPSLFEKLLDDQTLAGFNVDKEKAFQTQDYFEYIHKIVIRHRIIYIQTRMHIHRNEAGELEELVGTIQDVTDQKVKEQELEFAKREAEEASRAKTQFLNTMSHEIRTPLNAVVGMAYLLAKENPRPEQAENLEILQQSSEHLLDLINNILDFNRIESGMIRFEEEILSTKSFFQNIIRMWQPVAKEKNLHLQLILDYNLPPALLADGLRLTQIINNLLNNAIKFTEEGNISLKVSKRKQLKNSVKLRISVIDTGIGIPKSKQKEIFELFTQVHAHHDRRFGGSGLGLAICTKLLNFQGSALKVKSKLGEGSTFYFDLNFNLPEELHPKEASLPSLESPLQKLRGVKVLLVEDNLVNRQVMKRFFDAWECEYQMAESGREALNRLKEYQPDVILMDIQMPEMDGYETSRRIRQRGDAFTDKVPIIALTASSMMDTRDKLQEAGLNALIEKPFSPEKLYRCLAEYSHLDVE